MNRLLYEDDHQLFGKTVRTFADRDLIPRGEEFAAGHRFPRDVWLTAGEIGLLGLGVPTRYGGSEAGDYRFQAIALEELSRASAAAASSLSIHFDVCAPYLVDLTSEDQRQRWLPGFSKGELIAAIAMTEPSAGSDLAALRTTATPTDRGWVLNGSKTFITNGSTADLVIVAAKTDPAAGARGITLFAVAKDTPGFTAGPPLDKIGQLEADTAELFLTDVEVTRDEVIGQVDRGFAHMMSMLPQERIGSAVTNLAHTRWALEDTLAYVRERTAFGRTIGSFQHNAFILADLVTQVEVGQAFVDRCVADHALGQLDPVTAAKAKMWTATVQGQVLDACVQLFGGYGFMREYSVARAWADARVTRIWAGSNEIMKLIISRDLELL